ncbi:hypothetical protein BJ508DRAFT_5133 [Ascobolus immersus RN42]|uniref:Uncharacterized protein n=1 Tax=Ascobolus immersus RN42 TaxID=1160509 RepID=A0A3N4J314_ASCIM|nr:hypothetical protein BJ508DRAFT_5133 [Ascobolus immersus RN42]
MGNELSTKTHPSGKAVSSVRLSSKSGLKGDSLAGSTVVVSSLSCSAASTAPTTPDHLADSYLSKYENNTLQQTSTNQPLGNHSQKKMTDESSQQNIQKSLPSAEAYDKNESEERRKAAVVLQVSKSPLLSLLFVRFGKEVLYGRPSPHLNHATLTFSLRDLGHFSNQDLPPGRLVWNSLERDAFFELRSQRQTSR